jgi:(aminoalkyl)phosphonate N-acetyltransferase
MIKVKNAKPEDIDIVFDFICDLEKEVFDRRVFKRIYLDNLKNKNNIYFIAWDKKPVGYLSCHVQGLLHHCGQIAEIQEMYVVNDKRGLGIGKQLLGKLKATAKKRKIQQIEVTSGLKRKRAHKFYMTEDFILTSYKLVCDKY